MCENIEISKSWEVRNVLNYKRYNNFRDFSNDNNCIKCKLFFECSILLVLETNNSKSFYSFENLMDAKRYK